MRILLGTVFEPISLNSVVGASAPRSGERQPHDSARGPELVERGKPIPPQLRNLGSKRSLPVPGSRLHAAVESLQPGVHLANAEKAMHWTFSAAYPHTYLTVSSSGVKPAAETVTLSPLARSSIVQVLPGSTTCSATFRALASA